MLTRSILLIAAAAAELATAHTVITYPLWRGNNLISSGSTPPSMSPTSVGVDFNNVNGTIQPTFPWGMQYTFPCESRLAVGTHNQFGLLQCATR
jgi:hypothetical protein